MGVLDGSYVRRGRRARLSPCGNGRGGVAVIVIRLLLEGPAASGRESGPFRPERGKLYVVLTVGTKQIAVFRVRVDGQLKRLRRPPRELRGDEE